MQPIREELRSAAFGGLVRDVEYTFPDAIHACSWLRNSKTAHAFATETSLIGPYEVYNVQQVVRSLILHKCKLSNPNDAYWSFIKACSVRR